MNIQAATQRLKQMVAAQSNIEEIIETSRHFWEVEDYDEMARVEAEFIKHHQAIVAELKPEWGEPTFEGNWKDTDFPEWAAPESLRFAHWQHDSSAAYVAVQQHDKELPFVLVIGRFG